MAVDQLLSEVERFIAGAFPGASAAWLGGSVARGEHHDASDVDLVVVAEASGERVAEAHVVAGRPVDLLVEPADALRRRWRTELAERKAAYLHMCATGLLLVDTGGLGAALQAEARALFDAGPAPVSPAVLSSHEDVVRRLLVAALHAKDPGAAMVHAARAVAAATDYLLLAAAGWVEPGPFAQALLARYVPSAPSEFARALDEFANDRTVLELCIRGILGE